MGVQNSATTVEKSTEIRLKNMLFATDFSPCSASALPHALALARHFGAKLYLAHVIWDEALLLPESDAKTTALSEAQGRAELEMARILEPIRSSGIPYEVLLKAGEIPDVLSELIAKRDVGLMVIGTHGRRGLRRLLMGSVAEEIFRLAPCPVLNVGPNVYDKAPTDIAWQAILYATDLSPISLCALPYAFFLTNECAAHLTVLHVVEGPVGTTIHDKHAAREAFEKRLRELIVGQGHLWHEPELRVSFGVVAEGILETAADLGAGLIVLGVHHARPYARAATHLPNATINKVICQARCPVLTVSG